MVPDGLKCTEKTHSNQIYLQCMTSDEVLPQENEITHFGENVNTFLTLVNTLLILHFLFGEMFQFAGLLFTI